MLRAGRLSSSLKLHLSGAARGFATPARLSSILPHEILTARIGSAVDDFLVEKGVPREMIGAAPQSRISTARLPIDISPVSPSATLPSSATRVLRAGLSSPPASPFASPLASFSTSGTMESAAAACAAAAAAANSGELIAPSDELAFAWISPRSLIKGLEGGIIARLLAQPGIKLAGTRMFSPSEAFVDEYTAIHQKTFRPAPFKPFVRFIEDNLRPSITGPKGLPNHVMFMLFTGRNVRATLSRTIGNYLPDPRVGMVGRTIRGAYGDFIRDDNGHIHHFQPAIVSASTDEANELYLELFSRYMQDNGGIFDTYYDRLDIHKNYGTGMVIIKPDALERPSSLPGHIMDLFGSTGLHLVGCRVFSFSVRQAKEFYGFLEDIFVDKLRSKLEGQIKRALDKEFGDQFTISDTEYDIFTTVLRRKMARTEVDRIIEYMAGVAPSAVPENDWDKAGPARCLALLYRGENAIETIRTKLGSTDPSKAAVGTIRSDYGRDIMKNGAHASDSEASMRREREIIGLVPGAPSRTKAIIDSWLKHKKDYRVAEKAVNQW